MKKYKHNYLVMSPELKEPCELAIKLRADKGFYIVGVCPWDAPGKSLIIMEKEIDIDEPVEVNHEKSI